MRGGSLVLPGGVERADVLIGDDGRITAVGAALSSVASVAAGADTDVIDAFGLHVFPGAVDAHVHFNDPGREDWEGFVSGSAAAAAGGVTTVVDMPIDCDPPTITVPALLAKADAARRRSRVDVAMWAGLVPGNLGELVGMAEAGAVGFKAFACPSGWDDFPQIDDAALAAGCEVAAAFDIPVAVHCEPEPDAVSWAAAIAAQAGARLHVVHASAVSAVDEARRWPRVTVETCPHYLALNEEDAASIGATARCAPPIRREANRQGLLARLNLGAIDWVASDHSPCPPVLREGPGPWSGISGVQFTLPVLLSLGLDEVLVARVTTAAARSLRLPRKGAIAPGFDADLALVELDAEYAVTPDRLLDRHRASPFIGRRLKGEVVRTLVRGRTVYPEVVGPPPPGDVVLRPTAPSL